ncbi:MAG: hypothetical protein AMXMBFR66_29430 [Pseudomonadota bacterium]
MPAIEMPFRTPSATPAMPAGAAPSGLLAEITAGLASGNDLHELLARFLHPLLNLASAAAGAVRVLDDSGQRMHLVASQGLPAAVLEAERAVDGDCGACGFALQARQPAWGHDVSACARRSEGAYFGSACRRILAVPLAHRGRLLGIYNLFYEDASEPSPQVLALLESVGALLGLALENARLERENLRAALAGERQAIAADVHDSIGQSLAYVKMRLPLLQDAIRGCDQASAEGYFDDVREAVREAHANLRALLTHMRAPMHPRGLAHALAASAEAFRARGGPRLEFANTLPEAALTPPQEEQVYRIVQEALANVVRHAGARRAWLHVEREGDLLEVRIDDDGAGIAAAAEDGGTHYGLAIMRERAHRLGGTLEVGPRPGRGTRVCLRVPLPAATAAPAGALA